MEDDIIRDLVDPAIIPTLISLLQRKDFSDDGKSMIFSILFKYTSLTEEETSLVVDAGALPILLHLLQEFQRFDSNAVTFLVLVIGNLLLNHENLLPQLLAADIIRRLTDISSAFSDDKMLFRQIIWSLSVIAMSDGTKIKVNQCFPLLNKALLSNDQTTLESAARCLEDITNMGIEELLEVKNANFITPLINLLDHTDEHVILQTLITLSSILSKNHPEEIKQESFSLLSKLSWLIDFPKLKIRREVFCILKFFLKTEDKEIVGTVVNMAIFPKVIEILKQGEYSLQVEAASIIYNTCYYRADKSYIQYLMNEGTISALCSFLKIAVEAEDEEVVAVIFEALHWMGGALKQLQLLDVFRQKIAECNSLHLLLQLCNLEVSLPNRPSNAMILKSFLLD